MWYYHDMIDFPMVDLLDDTICTGWLECHLHPNGLKCPHCGRSDRRLFRAHGHFLAYRCRVCNGYYTLLTGTVFASGIVAGEPTARLARELKLSRKQLHTLRPRL